MYWQFSHSNVWTANSLVPLQVLQLWQLPCASLIRSLCSDLREFQRRRRGDARCCIRRRQGTDTLRLIFSGLSSTDRCQILCRLNLICCLPSADHTVARPPISTSAPTAFPGQSSGFQLPCCSSSCCAEACLLSVCFVQVAARALPIATDIDIDIDDVEAAIRANKGAEGAVNKKRP